jgi:preprotein translocase subunit SecG
VGVLTGILNALIVLISVFLICIVLIQRGRGGGLVGAFGAVGGSSAFGTKAGDVFTRVTVVVAIVWIVLSMLLVVLTNQGRSPILDRLDTPSSLSKDLTGSASKGGVSTTTTTTSPTTDASKAGGAAATGEPAAPGASDSAPAGAEAPVSVPAIPEPSTSSTPAPAPAPAPAPKAE